VVQHPENSTPINERQQAILFSVIAEYVSTGRAVSSKQLMDAIQCNRSPATIRRDLQILTQKGYVIQPHTSAGRIPTDRAFRLFVDTLKHETVTLPEATSAPIIERLNSLGITGQTSWHDVVRTLSDFLYQAALLVTPSFSEQVLRQLRFMSVGPTALLAVIITREGLVHNAFLKNLTPVTDRELERIHNYLNTAVAGRTLNEVRAILRAELEDARTKCDAMRERATLLGSKALASSIENSADLVVEGRSHLAAQPELQGRMAALMQFLEEKTRILALLDQAAQSDRGPLVIIGQEGGASFEGCAMISAPFGTEGRVGQIGVIGSSRMDYKLIIPMVKLAAKLMSRNLPDDD
jgi:heat-inducible transcriptional repressor